jgi:hypothetical protein
MNYPSGVKTGPAPRTSNLVMRNLFVPIVNQFSVLRVSVPSTPSNAHPSESRNAHKKSLFHVPVVFVQRVLCIVSQSIKEMDPVPMIKSKALNGILVVIRPVNICVVMVHAERKLISAHHLRVVNTSTNLTSAVTESAQKTKKNAMSVNKLSVNALPEPPDAKMVSAERNALTSTAAQKTNLSLVQMVTAPLMRLNALVSHYVHLRSHSAVIPTSVSLIVTCVRRLYGCITPRRLF